MFVAIYSTFDNLDEAKAIGRLLIEKKLVACVNLIHDVHSIYRWKGKIEEARVEFDVAVKEADLLIAEAEETNKLRVEKMKAAAQVQAALANAALSGVSANATLAFREARSDSTSRQDSSNYLVQQYAGLYALNQNIWHND